MKTNRRVIEVFSLSFLDVVSCGFGAIILLLVLIKVSEPQVIEKTTVDLSAQVAALQQKIETIQQESSLKAIEVKKNNNTIQNEQEKFRQLTATLDSILQKTATLEQDVETKIIIKKQMEYARQDLTEEMRRLNLTPPPVQNQVIGGVPVDSEYIIFVIDTSGSMRKHAWPLVRKKMAEILEIYPEVKGLQVLNDMGDYMFSQYSGKWIRDTPARRKSILRRLSSWNAFSNSSPVEGISAAINRFYSSDKRISIYVFGDDFSRGSIQDVVDRVARINKTNRKRGRVRIHAVGFPVLFGHPGTEINIARFSALMRRLAEDNNGSFVGLNSLNTR